MTGWGVTSSIHSVSTIRSSQTAKLVADRKKAASAGISAGIIPLFSSLETPAVFQADFQPPVSAAENSVPGGRGSSGQYRSAVQEQRSLGDQKRRLNPLLLRIKSEGFELPAPFRGSIA
jgi:hypothetical protein